MHGVVAAVAGYGEVKRRGEGQVCRVEFKVFKVNVANLIWSMQAKFN